MIKQLFADVYCGILTTRQAKRVVHAFCNARGLNPAIREPLTLLMDSEQGREKLKQYETFLTTVGWLMAKLAVQMVAIEGAVDQFMERLSILEMAAANGDCLVELNEVTKYVESFICPICGWQNKELS